MSQYTICNSMIVTANGDGTIPLNARVVATITKDDDRAEAFRLVDRANAHEAMKKALEEIAEWAERKKTTVPRAAIGDKARAALRLAEGE